MTDREKTRRRIVGIMNGLARTAGHKSDDAAQIANEFAKALDVLTAPEYQQEADLLSRVMDATVVPYEDAPIATTQIEAESRKLETTLSVDRGDLPSQKAGDLAPPNMIYIRSPEENLLELRRAVWAMLWANNNDGHSAFSSAFQALEKMVPTDPDVSDCEEVKGSSLLKKALAQPLVKCDSPNCPGYKMPHKREACDRKADKDQGSP